MDSVSMESVDATEITFSYAAGYSNSEIALLPAAHTITAPLFQAYCTAALRVDDQSGPPRLRLMTLAPLSAAQTIPSAMLPSSPYPYASSTFTGNTRTQLPLPETFGFQPATPAIPSPLLI